ncbi:MAG: serine--tRNA ligase [Pelagibacteraceae bacterium]|nr:serine--tRNA ligase [Pelagibacteraceae bacterium]MCI5079192.1 serine--tRNA ligase [Pelagibacteraceae bacterium]
MLNIKDIRSNPENFIQNLKKRNIDDPEKIINNILELDKTYRNFLEQKEKLLNERNTISKELGKNKDDQKKFNELSNKVSMIKEEIFKLDKITEEKILSINEILMSLPNLPHEDVPVGTDDKQNIEIRKEGECKISDKIMPHDEIGEKIKKIDFETAVKISGSRFVILKENLAKLERALINFMLDIHTEENGYTEYSVPVIVNEKSMYGTGQLPKFKEDQFQLNNNQWLIPTSEVSLTNMVSESIIEYEKLPLRFVSSTQCFRAEAGAAGKDTKGMIRQHQFTKVEMVSIVQPEFRFKELDRMVECAEKILKKLKLPYRVMLLSSGDMGFSAEKTFDLEVWLPSQSKYREISSCSSCGTFQANRMRARYKTLDKKNNLVATLNGSGLAVGRTIVAILENYQNTDGSISVPECLKKYMGNVETL